MHSNGSGAVFAESRDGKVSCVLYNSIHLPRHTVWICTTALIAGSAALASSPVISEHRMHFAIRHFLLPGCLCILGVFLAQPEMIGLCSYCTWRRNALLPVRAASQLFGVLLLFISCFSVLILAAWNDRFGIGCRSAVLNLFLIGLALSALRTKRIARDVSFASAPPFKWETCVGHGERHPQPDWLLTYCIENVLTLIDTILKRST